MKRDPAERFIKIHMDSISVKKIKPLVFWYKCEKCKKEFVRELIYNCSYFDYFWEHYFEYYGCSHCFQDKDEFVKWLQDTGRLYTEDSLRKICKKEELDNMKTYKKVLFYKEAESPLAWRSDYKAKTKIESIMWFDFKEGLRFSVMAGNISSCERNIFKAIWRVLEHESIGMAKYDCLKEDTRSKGLWKKL